MIDPAKDVWPFVRWIHGIFCYDDFLRDSEDVLRGEHEFRMTKESTYMPNSRWLVATWSNEGPHIKILDGTGRVCLLHFLPLAIYTKSGLKLKGPTDIALYFDPLFNPMLLKEAKRKRHV